VFALDDKAETVYERGTERMIIPSHWRGTKFAVDMSTVVEAMVRKSAEFRPIVMFLNHGENESRLGATIHEVR
jgi:hypothetical protein